MGALLWDRQVAQLLQFNVRDRFRTKKKDVYLAQVAKIMKFIALHKVTKIFGVCREARKLTQKSLL